MFTIRGKRLGMRLGMDVSIDAVANEVRLLAYGLSST